MNKFGQFAAACAAVVCVLSAGTLQAAQVAKFVDPAAGDYRIRPLSTCFNAGLYDATWMDGATDLDGNPRVKGKCPDIGCYECQDVRGLMLFVR